MAETYKKIDAVGTEPAKLEVTYDTVKKEFTEEEIDNHIAQLITQKERAESAIVIWEKRKDEFK